MTKEEQGQAWDFPFRASAVSACALALLLALLPTDAAEAARSGGRMGGSSRAARAPRPQPRAQPKASSTTRSASAASVSGPNISVGFGSPVISPFGFSPFGPFGGFGFSPFGFGLPVPVPSGPSSTDQMLQNQQQQDERKIDEQNQEIATLKKELDELKAKK